MDNDEIERLFRDNIFACLREKYGNNFIVQEVEHVRATRNFLEHSVRIKVGNEEFEHSIVSLTERYPDITLFDWEFTKKEKSRQQYQKAFGEFLSDMY